MTPHLSLPASSPAAQGAQLRPGVHMLSLPLTDMQLRPWRWWQQDGAWAILISGACQRCKPRTAELLGQKFLVSSNVLDIKPSRILTVLNSVLCIYTMNKLYNILKIAPLKSCRGHFIFQPHGSANPS